MKYLNSNIVKICIAFMTTILFVFCFEEYFFYCNIHDAIVISKIHLFIETLLFIFIYIFFISIFKRSFIAHLIISISLFTFSIVNQLTIAYTNSPILFSDFLFLSSISEISSILGNTLFDKINTLITPTIYYLLISILLNITSYMVDFRINGKIFRYSYITCFLIFIIVLLKPSYKIKTYILNNFFNADNRKDYARYTDNILYFSNTGILLGMYSVYLENIIYRPKDYNEKYIQEILDNVNNNNDTSFGTPNIIVVFAESFWNIDKINEIEFDKNILEEYNNLKKEGIYFEMISPSFGGISANVEFEFLTGANLMYFGKGYIPYMQLYTNSKYYSNPSIINELKNNNYYTKIVTYNVSKKLFNCGNFYKYIKVDNVEFNEKVDKKNQKGNNASDEYVINNIIEEFKRKEKGKKEFYMTLTMQGHMPYNIKKYDKYDIKLIKSPFDKTINNEITSYAQGLYDMDKQLSKLYNFIQEYDEPTIIVFYGDHLPYSNLIDQANYFNTDDSLINTFRKYNTESLILANFPIEEKNYKYIGPDLLSSYILNRMDINISKYYKWLDENINILPASNRYVSVDKEGNLFETNNLTDEQNYIYNMRRNIQYKYFIK